MEWKPKFRIPEFHENFNNFRLTPNYGRQNEEKGKEQRLRKTPQRIFGSNEYFVCRNFEINLQFFYEICYEFFYF